MNAQPPPPPPPPPFRPAPPPTPPYGRPPAGFSVQASELRPRRLWYGVAGLVAAISLAGAILLFADAGGRVESLTGVVNDLTPLEVPGETTVALTAGDDEAIYRQVWSASGGPIFAEPDAVSALECGVTGPGGEEVPLGQTLGVSQVTLNRDEYVTAFTFDAPRSGSYTIACDTGPRARPLPLLIGPEVKLGEIFGFIGGVFGGIFVLVVGVLTALAIVIPVAIMRASHKSRLNREAAAAGM